MSATDNLKPLFDKLGHNLEEIRVRALKNICSKLEHSLICDADLVQEKTLHIRLLEWFNFPSCPQQEQVLGLLLRLSKHPSAAAIYLDIGAVEFLTQLRPNVQSNLHKLVDSFLDNLFHLPLSQQQSHTQECIYRHSHSKGDKSKQLLPSHLLQPSDSLTEDSRDHRVSHIRDPYPSPPDEQPVGYFERSREEAKQPAYTPQTIPAASAKCFKFSTFPWIALTPTDRHVLSSTDSSLQGKDVSLVISACEFLSDVVFQDFPAEVFLQRPSIVKSLLSLLACPGEDSQNVSIHPVKTLTDLTRALQTRIYFYQDPALYTPKQDFAHGLTGSSSTSSFMSHSLGSTDSRPSIIGQSGDQRHRGDGQDGDNSAHGSGSPAGEGVEQTDIEDIQSLQFMQWTTPQLCIAIVEKLLPCMKTPDERFVLHGTELLHEAVTLLRESVVVDALWDDGSVPARELVDKLQDILEMLSDVLYLHYHGNLSLSIPDNELSQHRVAFIALSAFAAELLEAVLPVTKASSALSEDFCQVLALVSHDESLAYSFPEIRRLFLEYLQTAKFEAYALYCQAQQVAGSLKNTCNFLMESEELTDENLVQLISYAEDALHSMPYHLSVQYVQRCVTLTSQICRKTEPNPAAMKQSKQILLRLLAHPILSVRQETYRAVLSIVKEALGISHVAEPTSSATQGIVFLIDKQLLYQITCFGISERDVTICKSSEEILLYLLQSQLLLSAARWQQLLEAIIAVMPVLQGLCSKDISVGRSLLGLLDTDVTIETGALPLLERFRGTLRLMFSTDARIRSEGLGKLAWFLAHESESLHRLPLFSELDVTNLTSVFIIESPRRLLDEDTSRSVFQTDGVDKVYSIYTSEQVESDVKRSAGEQLAIVLQDPALQPHFLKQGGLDCILGVLKDGLRKPEPDSQAGDVKLLPAVMKMLRALVQHCHDVRHKLAHESSIYYSVLRCGLLLHQDYNTRQDVSELLAMLLFDEVAKVTSRSEDEAAVDVVIGFSLPKFVTKRYHLPFKPSVHHSLSPHTVPLPPDTDPLTAGTLAEMLRFTWNVSWSNGVEDAISMSDRDDEDTDHLFSPKLKLSRMDTSVLRTSYIPTALKQCVHNIENAMSHDMVGRAVLRLCSYMVISTGQQVSSQLQAVNWKGAVHRFLLVIPSSSSDEHLLGELLQALCYILKSSTPPGEHTTSWVGDALHNLQGALLGLLGRPDNQGEDTPETIMVARRQLNRQLLKFVKVYVATCRYSLVDKKTFECVQGDLTKSLLTRINRTDAAHFYNLASLESTLLALMHVTARPGWSQGCSDADALGLCVKMLQNLLEVVSAFHMGRGGMSMSYMGRGVTRCATVCLRHLAYEMATQLQSTDWPRNWLFSRQATAESAGESGFHWLIPLWMYRDPEVRAAGLGIAAALTSTEPGRITMTTQCQHIPGGIWGAAFSILLDQSECSLVRQQAALLLVNMTSQPMPSGSVESSPNVWQGPIVRNAETQVSVVGLTALLALLHHSSFYQEMLVLLSNYYPQPAIHPVSVAGSISATPIGSQTTMTTSGTVTPAGQHSSILHMSASAKTVALVSGDRPVTMGNNGGIGDSSQSTVADLSRRSSAQETGGRGTTLATAGTNTPASMLGSQPRDTSTPASTATDTTVQEYQSVASPCLVSVVTRLLTNILALAPEDTLAYLKTENLYSVLISMVDVSLLDAYLAELGSTSCQKQYLMTFRDVLKVYEDILYLMARCVVQDKDMKQSLLSNKVALKQIVRLLEVSYSEEPDLRVQCECLWRAVFSLFTALYQVDGNSTFNESTIVLVKHWNTIAGRLVTIVQDPQQMASPLWLSSLHFLAVCLSEECKQRAKSVQEGQYYVVHRLDTAPRDEDDIFTGCSGSYLCRALVKAFDAVLLKPLEQAYAVKVSVINALKALLALSNTAKITALEDGLIETIVEHIRHLHQKLSMDALELSSSKKKKENLNITELIFILDLLRNMMYEQSEVKLAAQESGLSNILHKCWAWCQMDPPLMSCMLNLLCTYTARCPKACSSLAFTSVMTLDDKMADKPLHSSNSLVHCVIKLIGKEGGAGNLPVLRTCFALLATLVLSPECRGILWKSNFLNEFRTLTPKKSKKTKASSVLEALWLDLLVNLSFSTEGQNIILKIEDAMGLLLEFGSSNSEQNQKRALLVLRNLCFHAANKPKLLANEKLLPFFVQCIEEGTPDVQNVSSSALLALLYNNQKAKVSMKSNHVLKTLQDMYNQCVNLPDNQTAQNCAATLRDVLHLLKS